MYKIKDITNKVHNAECLEFMKKIPDNSVDTLITDPPAGISFMGKDWDKDKGGRDEWIKWLTEIMEECYRVLKPGATALVWAIPRTSHWTATAIENAGFQIKDIVMHIFGSGFPKSTSISKQLDKGHKRKVIGKHPQPGKSGKTHTRSGGAFKKEIDLTEPATPEAKLWDGWGTALKPAAEHWILAMKQNDGSYAENALKHKVSGLNIDGSRIEYGNEKIDFTKKQNGHTLQSSNPNIYGDRKILKNKKYTNAGIQLFKPQGRFPSNVILECICDNVVEGEVKGTKQSFKADDYKNEAINTPFKRGDFKGRGTEKTQIHTNPDCPCYILDKQSGKLKSGFMKKGTPRKMSANPNKNTYMEWKPDKVTNDTYGDKGGASRFFYTAKASKSERSKGCEDLFILKEKVPEKDIKEIKHLLSI